MIFISSKNSSVAINSQYVEIENQPAGNSTYQELTVPKADKAYHNLSLK